jgi:hypothetical protein
LRLIPPDGRLLFLQLSVQMRRVRGSTIDPMADPVAADVIAAFEVAEKAGLVLKDCYKAGIDTWRRAHPDQTPEYASQKAVEILLRGRVDFETEA